MALHRRTLNRVATTSVRSRILARGVGIGFALYAAGAGIAFVMQLCLARWLGATAYGTYTYVIAWSGLLAIAAGMGFPILVLRVLPDYSIREDWARVRGVLATSLVGTVLVGGLIALLGITLVLSLGWQSEASVPDTVMGFVMVPLFALMALQQEMVRSFRRIGLAYAPSLLLRPSLVILGAACVLAFGHQLDSSIALALTITATVFVIGLQAWRFRRALGPIVSSARAVYERCIWIKAALPLLLVSGFIVIIEQTDIVMVGAILGDRAAGLYGAAAKTASLVGLILIAVNAIGAPMFSVLFAQDRHKDLQQLVSAITAWAFWPSCLLSIVLATCAPLVLTDFRAGICFCRVAAARPPRRPDRQCRRWFGRVAHAVIRPSERCRPGLRMGCAHPPRSPCRADTRIRDARGRGCDDAHDEFVERLASCRSRPRAQHSPFHHLQSALGSR